MESRSRATADRDGCWNFGIHLIAELKDYLGYPGDFQFEPVKSKPATGMTYSLPGAMEVDERGSWHLGVLITIYEAPNRFPQFRGLLHLVNKRLSEGSFIVKPAPEAPDIAVVWTDATAFRPVCEAIFNMIKHSFSEPDAEALAEGSGAKKIGFVV
jgi:hypothetical protein